MIFLEIKNGKDLAQFQVSREIATVEWTYYMDGGDITERSAVHIMRGRMKASMQRADGNLIVVTDLIPKFEKNKVTQKLTLMITGVSLLSKMLFKKLTTNWHTLFDRCDITAKEAKILGNLIVALEEAGPVLDKLNINPDKKEVNK